MRVVHAHPIRLTPRGAMLLAFTITTLVVLAGSALVAHRVVEISLHQEETTAAGSEARLAVGLGLAAALSAGRLTHDDLRVASSEYARADLPLTGLVVWSGRGGPLLAQGSGTEASRRPGLAAVARAAVASGTVRTMYATVPGYGALVRTAIPLGPRGHDSVVELDFSRRRVEAAAASADDQMFLFTALAALVISVLVLPLLVRLAGRLPLRTEPPRRAEIEDLARGVAHDELVLHYQPKVDVVTGQLVGVEALVRWQHPQRGLLAPADFLFLADDAPYLQTAIARVVVERALADCARWRAADATIPVAVNVTPDVLFDGPLIRLVQDALTRHGVDPQMLTVELTEGALMQRGRELADPLMELRHLGIAVSIDDFGTGHSSLARLRVLPVDELKVDRSFVARIATDDRDCAMARHIIELGLEFGLRVVAEGVEDEVTLATLRGLGCTTAQGYHISRPMTAEQLWGWVSGRELAPSRPALPV